MLLRMALFFLNYPVRISQKSCRATVPLPVIPMDEQKEIADYLNKKTARIDSIIADVTEQIEKLKEYRQSIISEVVTGKVAVG